jgi:hypothetical protein
LPGAAAAIDAAADKTARARTARIAR